MVKKNIDSNVHSYVCCIQLHIPVQDANAECFLALSKFHICGLEENS